MNLNDTDLMERVDASDMYGYIEDLPDQFSAAWAAASTLDYPARLQEARMIIVAGMGGSAISGDLAAALVAESCPVPIMSVRGYDLPACATGPDTLLVAMSHSGTTEETLTATQQAMERGAQVLAVTTGGKLGPVVSDYGGTVVSYSYDSPPRAALGWLYGSLLGALSGAGIVRDLREEAEEAVQIMAGARPSLARDVDDDENRAKRLAGQLIDRTPVVWAAGLLAPVARRWKTQFNENAKTAAYYEELPELNHNSVVGVAFPRQVIIGRLAPIQLRSRYDHPRVTIRHRVTQRVMLGYGIVSDPLKAHGKSRLAQQMNLVQFGDYTSYYLAMGYEMDPTPIDPIVALKEALADA